MLHVLGSVAVMALLAGCGARQAPRIHFASATEAQLRASGDERVVWYEFRQGDDVPVALLFTGVVEAAQPVRAKATRTFWLVMERNAPPRFSFDGEHVVEARAGTAGIALGRDGEKGENQVGLVVYLGKPEDAPAPLREK